MLQGTPPPHRLTTLLCARSHRIHALIDDVLKQYVTCVVNDANVACRKALLGSFHAYLVIDQPNGSAAVGLLWRSIRRVDFNTPFVLVAWSSPPKQLLSEFKAERDALIVDPASSREITAVIDRMVLLAANRSLEARSVEARAIQHDLSDRLHRLEQRVGLCRQSLARAQEHVMRAHAIREFLRAGGAKAFFDSAWDDTFEEALRESYDAPTLGSGSANNPEHH